MEKFSTLVFKEKEQIFNMDVNGTPVTRKTIGEDVLCSSCNLILVSFDSQSIKYRRDYIEANMKDKLKYCPSCGARINYSNNCILDAVIEESTQN